MFEDINKVLLITDMDGTFLPASKIPSEKNLKAVERLKNAGGKFSIATGRAVQASKQYFDSVKVNCPIIMCNGGMVYDLNNHRQIYDVFLPDSAKTIVAEILENNPDIGCEVLTLENVYVPQLNKLEQKHLGICKVKPVMCSLDEIRDKWYKVLFAVEPDDMDRVMNFVDEKGYSGVDFVRSSIEYYEILPLNISKGSALEKMKTVCGMEDYTIVAVGDYNNDLEMLKVADVGFCPSNATDEVKAAADIVLPVSCEEDAIAAVIDYIFDKTGN